MKRVSVVLFTLILFSCSKEERTGLGEGMCSTCGPPYFETVNLFPDTNQFVVLRDRSNPNVRSGPTDYGYMNISHSADTFVYYIPNNTMVNVGGSLTITGAELGFAIDTIADTLYLRDNYGNIFDVWRY